jgi:hypothetical protein
MKGIWFVGFQILLVVYPMVKLVSQHVIIRRYTIMGLRSWPCKL